MESNNEDKLILAKLSDKVRFCKTRNKIVNTEFLNLNQKNVITKGLAHLKEKNYIFDGGYEDAESKVLIIYPEKLTREMAEENIKNIIKAIRVIVPNEQRGKYQHRDYLGTIMQFGLERERIGDILVYENQAYIIVLAENAQYIKDSLLVTSKFKKSKIDIINIDEIEAKKPEFEDIKITVLTPRLDNYVSEIAKTSRTEAARLIESELVSVNCKIETKLSKQIELGDIIIIRGKGKFIVSEYSHINRKDRQVIMLKKYK